jgi:hypothetical protein
VNPRTECLFLLLGLGSALLFPPPARAFDLLRRSLPEVAQGAQLSFKGAQLSFIGRREAVSCHGNDNHGPKTKKG